MPNNNNDVTTHFGADIGDLKKAMQDAKRAVAVANSEFQAAASSMDDWSNSSEGLNAKLKQLDSNLTSQKTVLSALEEQYRQVEQAQGKSSKAAQDLEIKINKQKAAINQTEAQIGQYGEKLEEVESGTKELAEASGGLGEIFGGLAKTAAAAAAAIGAAVVAGLTKAVSFSDEAKKALNSFAAETGATAAEMGEFEDAMLSIYNNNFGESMDDIAQAMAEVKKQAGDMGADELEEMTTNALMMRDTFEFEVNESMRAAKMLMDQFGVSGEEAYNLIAQGAQGGLDKNGDLLDSINEYSVHFKQLGLGAEEMFNMLANGSAAGTFSVDKLGDAIKEFGIRAKDGSKSTVEAFDYLGYDADELFKAFSEGGEEAAIWTRLLIDEIATMPEGVEKTTVGVALFGSMWEDLGAEGIRALSQINGGVSLTKDALDQINKVKYNSVGEAIQGIGRNLQTGLIKPIGDALLPKLSELAAKFSEVLNNPETQAAISDLTAKIANLAANALDKVLAAFGWIAEHKDQLIGAISGIAGGFVAFKAASIISKVITWVKNLGTGLTILKGVMAAMGGPITIIITIIGALVAAFITLWNTSDEFRAFWINLWEGIKKACGAAKDWIAEKIKAIARFFTSTLPQAIDNTAAEFKALPGKIATWLQNAITNIITWGANMVASGRAAARQFIDSVVALIKELPQSVWTWLQNVVSKVASWGSSMASKGRQAAQELVNAVTNKIKELPGKMAGIGQDVVRGIWNGIDDMTGWIANKISGFVGDVEGWFKDFFGIASPSKLMRDQVGKWIPEGIAVGIDKNAKSVLSSVRDLTASTVGAARNGISGVGRVVSPTMGGNTNNAAVGGTVNNFYQTINSPKQLKRLDVYRNTKNLLGYAGGAR